MLTGRGRRLSTALVLAAAFVASTFAFGGAHPVSALPPLPDLAVRTFAINQPFLAGGQGFVVVRIVNRGDAPTPSKFRVTSTVTGFPQPPILAGGSCGVTNQGSDKFAAFCDIPKLDPGEAVFISIVTSFDGAGSYGIRTVADSTNRVVESREDNNVSEASFPVIAAADLDAALVLDTAPLGGEGTTAVYTAHVANEGFSTATGVVVRFKIVDGAPVKIVSVTPDGDKPKCTKISDSEFRCTLNRLGSGSEELFAVKVKRLADPSVMPVPEGALELSATADGASNEVDFSDNVAQAPLGSP